MSRQYLVESVKQISSNIENYFNQINKMGYLVSTNLSILSLYSDDNFISKNQAFDKAIQLISFIGSYDNSIIGVVTITPSGEITNLFGGDSDSIVSQIESKSIYTDVRHLNRGFYFFKENQKEVKDYFIHYVPVFKHGTSLLSSTKVATVIFIFNKSTLNSFLEYKENGQISVYSLYQQNEDMVSGSALWSKTSDLKNIEFYSQPLTQYDFVVKGANISSALTKRTHHFLLYMVLSSSTILLIIILIILSILNYIILPMNSVLSQLDNFDSGDLKKRINRTNIREIDYFVDNTNKMIDKISQITKRIFYAQDKLYESELRKTEAELYALQSQVNPHFLYNSLQCIRGLATMGKCEEIKDISLAMADVFKYSIAPGEYVSILDEIKIIYKYLSIYKIRLNNQLDYIIDVPDEILDCKTIKMIIQPIVENTMIHAYKNTEVSPKIHIFAHIADNDILFRIIDNGTGIEYDNLLKINEQLRKSFSESIKSKSSIGQGLYNINRRIKLKFGEKYGIKIYSNPNGNEVDILIPKIAFKPDDDMVSSI